MVKVKQPTRSVHGSVMGLEDFREAVIIYNLYRYNMIVNAN